MESGTSPRRPVTSQAPKFLFQADADEPHQREHILMREHILSLRADADEPRQEIAHDVNMHFQVPEPTVETAQEQCEATHSHKSSV